MNDPVPPRMRAARFLGQGRIAIEERPVPAPGPGEGRLNPFPVITHRFELDAIEDAFRLFWSGQAAKVLVCP